MELLPTYHAAADMLLLVPTCHAAADMKGGGETSLTEEAIVGGKGGELQCRRGRQREMGLELLLHAVSVVSGPTRPRGHDGRCGLRVPAACHGANSAAIGASSSATEEISPSSLADAVDTMLRPHQIFGQLDVVLLSTLLARRRGHDERRRFFDGVYAIDGSADDDDDGGCHYRDVGPIHRLDLAVKLVGDSHGCCL
ncbi:hypothetical protein ACLOJK_007100 [Asimina triloba]